MTRDEFLESGLLEEYVMGLLSDDKAREVGDYIARHPEVGKIYQDYQNSIQSMAEDHSMSLPEGSKEEIMRRITEPQAADVPDTTPSGGRAMRQFVPYALAVMMTAVAVFSFFQMMQMQRTLNMQKQAHERLQRECMKAQEKYAADADLIAFYEDPATRMVVLSGNEKAEDFQLVARHNNERQQVQLNVIQDAKIPSDKMLCLWGDVNGKMILIAKLDDIRQGQLVDFDPLMESFNVTIEDKAEEVDHPDVSQLIASVAIG